jgi:HEAT repeat protein
MSTTSRTLMWVSMLVVGTTWANPRDAGPPPVAVRLADDAADEDAGSAEDERDELATVALQGLVNAPPERALPLVKKVLDGKRSERVKSHALFLLGQMNRPEATALLREVATTKTGRLQLEAIRAIGISGNSESLEALAALAKKDPSLTHKVLQAFLIAGRKDLVAKVGSEATSDEAFEAAANTLATMGALAELRQLNLKGRATRHVLRAYALAGDLDTLAKMLDDPDPKVQLEALNAMVVLSSPRKLTVVRDFYARASTPELKRAAMQVLFVAGDADGLANLYRASKSSADKRELLRLLALTRSDRALEFIDSALEEK